MDTFNKKTLKTTRGFDYTYYVTPDSADSRASPALFFLHGFPDHAHMWDDVIDYIQVQERLSSSSSSNRSGKWRIVAPDLLGYDGTSKPTDPAAYDYGAQVADLAEILDAEGIDKVVLVGHDWGSVTGQRFYWHRPERVVGLVLASVAYLPPSLDPDAPPFDLDAANRMTEQMVGYPQIAYWELTTAPDGAEVLDGNLEAFWEAMHGDREGWMRDIFCTRGAWKAFQLGEHPMSGKVTLKPFAQREKRRRAFLERYGRDGFAAPLQWYVAARTEVHRASDTAIPRERLTAKVPVLYVGSTGDVVGRHEMILPAKEQGLLPDLEVHVVEDCGHWIPMEKPEELGAHIWGFLEKRFQ